MKDSTYIVIRNAFSFGIQDSALDEETRSLYNNEVKNEILEVSKKKKYTPFVAKYLSSIDLDKDFWTLELETYRTRNRKILYFIEMLFQRFAAANIKSIFVYENFGALISSHNDIGLYSSGDVDLCADAKERDIIKEVFIGLGWQEKETNSNYNVLKTTYKGIIDGVLPYRINVAYTPIVRYRLPITINDNVTTPKNHGYFNSGSIRIPSPEALLYMNIMRISAHGYVRSPDIRLYVDIYNAACCGVDWNKVLGWAERDNNLTRVVVVANIANTIFGTEVPCEVLELKDSYSLKASKLLPIVMDKDRRQLKMEPSKLHRFLTECYSCNKSPFGSILNILFPNKEWLMSIYGKENSRFLMAYVRYFFNVLKGK